ncbi:hypothetical protein IMZ08_17615 [Bacillus luteolus]|uniref:DUF2268 domain-containing protein n=1 Tax=Litchfieldia luteola TaxID=682179 RepID=A0ABR9QN68_9BACI|nr:DUF2268 domain-containing putative Zn-dependent protease [Cytobacillus luteolus]MBE4909856.1 hypothetical protein [Cytobacillus luteolus]MBP1942595.1 hypothetical protein [Cytobacillus luteolus]
MKRKIHIFILSSLLILSGCTSSVIESKVDEDKTYTPPSSYTFTHNNQQFEIIPLYEELMYYVSYVKEGNVKDENKYKEFFLDPFREKAFSENDGYYIYTAAYEDYFGVPRDIYQFERDILALSEKQDLINSAISEALIKSSNMLPGGKKRIYIIPFNTNGFSRTSAGRTFNEEVVLLRIGSSFQEDDLKNVAAHEYHHTIFMEHEDKVNQVLPSLISNILLEGKAVAFAKMIYPDIAKPMLEEIPYEDEKHVWEEVKKDLNSADYKLYDKFLLGDGHIPPLSNYKVGYQIMKSFLEQNPNVDVLEWTLMSSADILSKSKYEDKFID